MYKVQCNIDVANFFVSRTIKLSYFYEDSPTSMNAEN